MQLVWLKRDLRISDHIPLLQATQRGKVRLTFVFEPSLWQNSELDIVHFDFVCQSLIQFAENVHRLGGSLVLAVGELPDLFDVWHQVDQIQAIYSHQETGNQMTFDRDRRVACWARDQGIPWNEYRQQGIVRPTSPRDQWAAQWGKFVVSPVASPIETVAFYDRKIQALPDILDELQQIALNLYDENSAAAWIMKERAHLFGDIGMRGCQIGGESNGLALLNSFLETRGIDYRTQMSSPLTADVACSRLSPHLAWGTISVKQVYQQTQQKILKLKDAESRKNDGETKRWGQSLRSFSSRLAWRCHFMQKLEDEPELEWRNLCPAYDGLREDAFCKQKFAAWQLGQTGFPMIDACMRSLRTDRWINFRMRAMLVSFASYHLWLHWRPVAFELARLFLDFEPGIHYPQVQMQSGTTGINTVRIYSPTKQALDQDPQGDFIRRHLPELSDVPLKYLAEPFKMPPLLQREYHCRIGIDYPAPIVDHLLAYRAAQQKIFAVRNTKQARQAAHQVYLKHGSRLRNNNRGSSSRHPPDQDRQLRLFD